MRMTDEQWKYDLRTRMEGYSEEEPRGLREAVAAAQARALRRRRMQRGWAFALPVAAALAAVAILWRPAAPEQPLTASETIPEERPVPAGNPEIQPPERLALAQPAPVAVRDKADGTRVPVTPKTEEPTGKPMEKQSGTPVEEQSGTPVEEQAARPDGDAAAAASPSATPEPPATGPENPPEKPDAPIDWGEEPRKQRNRPTVSLSLAAGMAPGQVSLSEGTGYGMYDAAPLMADGGSKFYAGASMLTRNKPATSDRKYRQTARFAIMANVGVTGHWSFETGLILTQMHADNDTQNGIIRMESASERTYLGIPLWARYDFLRWNVLDLYASAGPMFEFCTRTNGQNSLYANEMLLQQDRTESDMRDRLWSLHLGTGIQVRFLRHSALFAQPGLSYHFCREDAPASYYTEHPLSFNLTFGYRFRFPGGR